MTRESDGQSSLLDLLRRREIDIALAELPVPGEFASEVLRRDPYVLITPAASTIAKAGCGTLRHLGSEPVLGRLPCPSFSALEDRWQQEVWGSGWRIGPTTSTWWTPSSPPGPAWR